MEGFVGNKEIKISSEDEALALLKQLVEGVTLPESGKVTFESWPKFVIRIEGADFDNTIPTRIMPTLLELQKEINRIYCLTVYGEDNTRKLTKKDREQLELVVRVDKGSSFYETLLDTSITKALQDAVSKMSPEQLTAVLIVAGLSTTSLFAWKHWLNYKIKAKELDHKENELDHSIQLSELEKDKMEIVRKAAEKFPMTQTAASGMDHVRESLSVNSSLKIAWRSTLGWTISQVWPLQVSVVSWLPKLQKSREKSLLKK